MSVSMVRPSTTDEPAQAAAAFERARPRLFAIAYRIVANRAESEDVVQDAWLRWQACDRSQVRDPTAFLATTVRHLALNVVQSGRMRREGDFPAGLTELPGTAVDPLAIAADREDLERAVALIMDRLTHNERAAFVPRVAFEYPYSRIARLLDSTEASIRQLVCRARKRLAAPSTATRAQVPDYRPLLAAFLIAARNGDMVPLETVLFGHAQPDALSHAPLPRGLN